MLLSMNLREWVKCHAFKDEIYESESSPHASKHEIYECARDVPPSMNLLVWVEGAFFQACAQDSGCILLKG